MIFYTKIILHIRGEMKKDEIKIRNEENINYFYSWKNRGYFPLGIFG